MNDDWQELKCEDGQKAVENAKTLLALRDDRLDAEKDEDCAVALLRFVFGHLHCLSHHYSIYGSKGLIR